ncbi:MAG: S26 family signal peptidase [Phycisphaerales bacterium]
MSDHSSNPPVDVKPAKPKHEGSIKETLISLVISLAMALIFKLYIIEAYRIPTGSMAPTLLGAHMRAQGPQTGYNWAIGPWYYAGDMPFGVQGPMRGPDGRMWGGNNPDLMDPMTGLAYESNHPRRTGSPTPVPRRTLAGDRILVQKYLYEVREPRRFEVVVFKNPTGAEQNYIKRVTGMPNEHLWLVDGDVFTAPMIPSAAGTDVTSRALERGAWQIQRKPFEVQRALWQPVFSSEYSPLNPHMNTVQYFESPWVAGSNDAAWTIGAQRSYRYEASEPTTLEWDSVLWPVIDFEPYNDGTPNWQRGRMSPVYPVSDVRVRAGIQPDTDSLRASVSIMARQHEFRAVLENGRATIQMRSVQDGVQSAWTTMMDSEAPAFRAGRATNIEFWHHDQQLLLLINGRVIGRPATYDWSPDQRLEFVTGRSFENLRTLPNGAPNFDSLLNAATYEAHGRPSIRFSFEGSPVTLHRVGLDRDIYYRPFHNALGTPRRGFAWHPDDIATLGPDHFLMLGDNSGSSLDSRGWPTHGITIDPNVADQIDDTPGVVHRDLLLGKAFFVYFPAPHSAFGRVPIPDFGRMRLIE